MKVSVARIRLYLKKSKVLSDGTHPIMLMCSFNGRKEVSTSYSCSEKYWDSKQQCVKKGYSNWVMINHHIKKMKDDAIALRDEYERLGEVYTPSMILSPRKVLSAATNDLKTLIQQYISEKGIEANTVKSWWIVYRNIVKYNNGREIIVNEINESFCRGYARWMSDNGLSDGSIRHYLTKVGAICRYAVKKGIMAEYPLDGWKFGKQFRDSKNELYIHHRSMDVLIDLFLDSVIDRDGELWSYKDGILDELMDIHSRIYSLYLYIIGYFLKGISPIDISLLRKDDIRVVEIRNIFCYAIDGSRSKSGMLYKIRVIQNSLLSNVLIRTMLMFNDGTDYFLPSLKGFRGRDIRKAVNNLYTLNTEHLLEWFRECNDIIARKNVENGHSDDIPFIDMECRYYSYRHSYIMSELQKPSVNILALAQSVGKSPRTLHQYISMLGDVDLI